MIPRRRFHLDPFFTAVAGGDHQSARAHRKGALRIENVQAIERVNQTCRLMFPAEAAVRGVENQTVGADGPAVKFIRGEANGSDVVTLGFRILPLPSALRNLRAGGRQQRQRDEGHETEAPGELHRDCHDTPIY